MPGSMQPGSPAAAAAALCVWMGLWSPVIWTKAATSSSENCRVREKAAPGTSALVLVLSRECCWLGQATFEPNRPTRCVQECWVRLVARARNMQNADEGQMRAARV